jgi:hypothetical protein
MLWLLIPGLTWAAILAALVPPKEFYPSLFDRMVKGKTRDDRPALELILRHLIEKPEEWSLSRDQASYPLESKAKQIYLNFDANKGLWTYTIAATGERERTVDGFYGQRFKEEIARENSRRQQRVLLRDLYKIEGPLLLK